MNPQETYARGQVSLLFPASPRRQHYLADSEPSSWASSTMDWTDGSSTLNATRGLTTDRSFGSASMSRTAYNSARAHSERVRGDNGDVGQPRKVAYRSVLQHMRDVATDDPDRRMEYEGLPGKHRLAPLPTDVQLYLKKQRLERAELTAEMDLSFAKTTQADARTALIQAEWDSFKLRILQDLGSVCEAGFPDLLTGQREKYLELKAFRVNQTQPSSSTDRQMNIEETSFARALRECNEHLICNRKVNMAAKFAQVAESRTDQPALQLWRLFAHMSALEVSNPSMYPNLSQDENTHYRESPRFREDVVRLGRRYLENIAYEPARVRARNEPHPASHLSEEARNVMSHTRTHILKHKTALSSSLPRIHGLPVWALIFYSLRLGCRKAAVEFAQDSSGSATNFVEFLRDYDSNNGCLSVAKENEVRNTYARQSSALNEDPYKKAVLAVLGRTDITENFTSVVFILSDWMWMKLAQTEPNGKQFSLINLQRLVRDKCTREEIADEAEVFMLFALTGQFEVGIECLFRSEKFRPDAVHMALASKHSGVLLVSSKIGFASLMVQPDSEEPDCRLDFVSLVKNYVREFRKHNSETVVEYYYHLMDIPAVKSDSFDYEFDNMFELSVFKLARDTKSVMSLFGKIDDNGRARESVVKGVVHKFVSNPERLMVAVATDLDASDQYEEAITLYECAGKTELMLKTVLREICYVLVLPVSDPRRQKAQNVALRSATRCLRCLHCKTTSNEFDPAIAKVLRNGQSEVTVTAKNVFLMLDVMTFFDLFERGKHREAVQLMEKIDLIPLSTENISDCREKYAQLLLPEVRRCVAEVSLYTAQAVVKWYEWEKRGLNVNLGLGRQPFGGLYFGDQVSQLQDNFRQKIRPLLEFAASIPTPQFPDLMDNLLKLETAIN